MPLPSSILQGEADGIQEGDVVTLTVWLSLRRPNGLTVAVPHCPLYPFAKDEAFWVLLADTNSNAVWVSQRVTFLDEHAAVRAASDYARETAEGEGLDDEQVRGRGRAPSQTNHPPKQTSWPNRHHHHHHHHH